MDEVEVVSIGPLALVEEEVANEEESMVVVAVAVAGKKATAVATMAAAEVGSKATAAAMDWSPLSRSRRSELGYR